MKPKIYLYCAPTGKSSYGYIRDAEPTGDVIGYAMAEDGEVVATHFSSGVNWSKHDLGLSSNWKHNLYKTKYPEGYELEWIDFEDLDGHDGFQAARELNAKRVLDALSE